MYSMLKVLAIVVAAYTSEAWTGVAHKHVYLDGRKSSSAFLLCSNADDYCSDTNPGRCTDVAEASIRRSCTSSLRKTAVKLASLAAVSVAATKTLLSNPSRAHAAQPSLTLTTASATSAIPPLKKAQRPRVYSIENTNPPCMLPRTKIGEQSAISRFTGGGVDVLLLGEHHNSVADHILQADLLKRISDDMPPVPASVDVSAAVYGGVNSSNRGSSSSGSGRRGSVRKRRVVVGLEMVQQTPEFQAALDEYVNSRMDPKITLEEADQALFAKTDWATRWFWDFNAYKPVLHLARSRGIRLVALNVPSEVQDKVKEGGLDGLTKEERAKYVPDPDGFVGTVTAPGFQKYAEKVIFPSYAFHAQNNLLGKNPSPEKFFSGRILWDEAMASRAAREVTQADPSGETLCVVLLGIDHAKYGYGVAERAKRYIAPSSDNEPQPGSGRVKTGNLEEEGQQTVGPPKASKGLKPYSNKDARVLSVLLNPTPQDSISDTEQLRLSLAYGTEYLSVSGGGRPLADYVWFSDSPPIKVLTRVKNPISREGDKPAGESSIIGAF